ncbi:unnamed protein product [Prorocentrum cordatum]|uniref:Uncharacterized protein n=1 Tax=Prorocentrum cordatum TaxID=2364126 RepID=A0ABN9PR04_9DINO|nr:unnamed protein product [Polarella glacialis]
MHHHLRKRESHVASRGQAEQQHLHDAQEDQQHRQPQHLHDENRLCQEEGHQHRQGEGRHNLEEQPHRCDQVNCSNSNRKVTNTNSFRKVRTTVVMSTCANSSGARWRTTPNTESSKNPNSRISTFRKISTFRMSSTSTFRNRTARELHRTRMISSLLR